jgi:hypothetical protein
MLINIFKIISIFLEQLRQTRQNLSTRYKKEKILTILNFQQTRSGVGARMPAERTATMIRAWGGGATGEFEARREELCHESLRQPRGGGPPRGLVLGGASDMGLWSPWR